MTVTGRQILNAGDAFLLSFVRQHWAGNHVANGINALDAGGKMFVDGDVAFFVQLNADALKPEVFGVGHPTDGDEHPIANERITAFALDSTLAILHAGASDFAAQTEFQSLLFK